MTSNNKSNKPLCTTKLSKCGYCKIEMLDQTLKRHCLDIHKKPKQTDKDIPVTTYFLNTKKREVCGSDSDDTNTECQQSIRESCEIEIENA